MQNSRWLRPLLAFLITFGVMAMGGSIVRVVVVYHHFFAIGLKLDDPTMAAQASVEVARLDQLYTPTFLLVATAVSLAAAVVFALWRPKAKVNLPPPL